MYKTKKTRLSSIYSIDNLSEISRKKVRTIKTKFSPQLNLENKTNIQSTLSPECSSRTLRLEETSVQPVDILHENDFTNNSSLELSVEDPLAGLSQRFRESMEFKDSEYDEHFEDKK